MRVAVLADIHGNLPALEAVLHDVREASVDRIVLNGDIANGPLAGETLDRLGELGDRAIWVHGNGERHLLAGYAAGSGSDPDSDPDSDNAGADDRALGATLTQAQRDLIADLPLTVTLEIDGLGATLFCHATPRRDDEMLLVDSPPERYAATLAGITAETVVLGHTHMPFDRLFDRRRVVNPGSVGMPYGHKGAAWAVLGPYVELRRSAYDTAAAAARLAGGRWPKAAEWAAEYVEGRYSDREALEAFTEIADAHPADRGEEPADG